MSESREILQYFSFEHLPEGILRDTSGNFSDFAHAVDEHLPDCMQKTVALHKLLEAKDAAVRAALSILKTNDLIAKSPEVQYAETVDEDVVGFVEIDEEHI